MGACQSRDAAGGVAATEKARHLRAKVVHRISRRTLNGGADSAEKKLNIEVVQDGPLSPATDCTAPETPSSIFDSSGSGSMDQFEEEKEEEEEYLELEFSVAPENTSLLTEVITEEVDPDAPSDEEDHYEELASKQKRNEPLQSSTALASSILSHGSLSRCRHRKTSPPGIGPMHSVKARNSRSSKNPNSIVLRDPPPTLTPPDRKDAPNLLKPTRTSVRPHTMAHFNKLKIQAKLAAKQARTRRRVKKLEDRYEDVRGHRMLWKEMKDIEQAVAATPERDPSQLEKYRKHLDLHKPNTWYFDFQELDDSDGECDYDDDQSQSNMSLLSSASMESQRRYYAEKTRRREEKEANQEQRIYGAVPPNAETEGEREKARKATLDRILQSATVRGTNRNGDSSLSDPKVPAPVVDEGQAAVSGMASFLVAASTSFTSFFDKKTEKGETPKEEGMSIDDLAKTSATEFSRLPSDEHSMNSSSIATGEDMDNDYQVNRLLTTDSSIGREDAENDYHVSRRRRQYDPDESVHKEEMEPHMSFELTPAPTDISLSDRTPPESLVEIRSSPSRAHEMSPELAEIVSRGELRSSPSGTRTPPRSKGKVRSSPSGTPKPRGKARSVSYWTPKSLAKLRSSPLRTPKSRTGSRTEVRSCPSRTHDIDIEVIELPSFEAPEENQSPRWRTFPKSVKESVVMGNAVRCLENVYAASGNGCPDNNNEPDISSMTDDGSLTSYEDIPKEPPAKESTIMGMSTREFLEMADEPALLRLARLKGKGKPASLLGAPDDEDS